MKMQDGDFDLRSKYPEARFVTGVIDALGSLLTIIGILWFGWSLIHFFNATSDNPASLVSLLSLAPSLGMTIAGLLVVAHSQFIRAALDTADCVRELLVVQRDQKQ